MLHFNAVRPVSADNENLTAAYRESFIPVTKRSMSVPEFRWGYDVYPILYLADCIETYKRKKPEVFEALYDEYTLEVACLCWSLKRHRLTRRHRPKKKKA